MKKNKRPQIGIAWAKMPLSEEELELIHPRHRKRPFLLCENMGSFYYAFPCTSNIEHNNTRYENQKVILKTDLNFNKSLVNLGQVYELPKENIIDFIHPIRPLYNNEIIKKINACSDYSNYPEDFIEYYAKFDYTLETDDLVELYDQLYIINESKRKYFNVSKVYPYPVNKSTLAEVDGLKYYISLESKDLHKSNPFQYRSHIPEFSTKEKKPISIKEKDFSKLYNLEPGMIISYNNEDKTYKMIVLENCITDLYIITGEEKDTYNNFELMTIPVDTNIDYKVVGLLNESRLAKLNSEKNKIKEKI